MKDKKVRSLKTITIKRVRCSPDYNILTAILAESNILLKNTKIHVPHRKPVDLLNACFIFKVTTLPELFRRLSDFTYTLEHGKAAEGLANDLIYHLYGYNNW